jgi:uncharacterized membrane protein YphA (DoxX/SURF4 family)
MTDSTTSRPDPVSTGRFTRIGALIARLLMGAAFTFFGLNGFFNFIPPPKEMPPGLGEFFGAMVNTRYMLPLIAGTQVLVGLLLLVNRFVPLALVLIAPVIVNIIAIHVFLDPAGIGPGIVVLLLEAFLVWAYRKSYITLFAARATPGA